MKVITYDTHEEMSQAVANIIIEEVEKNPKAVFCLPTGGTPVTMYEELVRRHREENIDFSQMTAFNLDEYFGLDGDHPQSYWYFMKKHLFSHINTPQENIHHIHVPSNDLNDVEHYCNEYEAKIDEVGGFDILIDGIGLNGHIGFNEPADELKPYTHLGELDLSTIEANSRFFSSVDEVPRYALTMGLASIFKAKRIMLIASGAHKAEIVRKFLKSDITTQIPATLLHLHPNVELHLDREAAKLID